MKLLNAFVLVICTFLLTAMAFSYDCPQDSVPPHPQIVSAFLADSSCLEHDSGNPGTERKDCFAACEHNYTTYCVALNAGNTYAWSVVGGTITSGQGTNCVTILWGPMGNGTISVVETTPDSCTGTEERCVKIINSPIAMFTANNSVCKNVPVNFINQSIGALTYLWNFGDGNTSTLVNPTHTYTNGGTYTVTLVAYNKCGCLDSTSMVINVSNLSGPVIDCPTTVCNFAEACYSTSSGCPGAVYNWIVTGGTIVGPSNTNTICVQWGAGPQGTISLFITGCGTVCNDTTTVVIPIISSNGPISGPSPVCVNSTSVYSLPLWPGTYYNWQVTNGTIIIGWNTNSIQVQWPPTPGNAMIIADWNNILLGCGGRDTIIVKVRDEFQIFNAPDPFCVGATTTFSGSGPANWTVTGGTILAGNGTSTIQVQWTAGGTQTVTATPLNPNLYCTLTSSVSVTVVAVPPPLAIVGPDTVCAGSTYSYTATPSGPGFSMLWSVVGGTIVGSNTANPVMVQWSGPGTISVQQVMTGSPFCPSAPISKNVSLFSVSSISGPTIVCMDGTSIFTAGSPNPNIDFVWTIEDGLGNPSPAGSITSGQGTNTISVLWHGPGGSAVVKLVVCGNTLTLPVTINPKPTPTINMTGYVCDPGGGVNLTVTPAYASYSWSNGATTQSTSVGFSGQYCVTVTDANGCQATKCIDVPYTPPPTASISTPDPINYCSTPPPVINTTLYALQGPNYQYFWSPGGQTTPTITATAAGTYYVIVTDAVTGCKDTSNAITITVAPCPGGGPSCTPQPYTLSFTTSNVGGQCNNIQFTASSTNITNYSWTFGDGNTAGNTPNPTNIYAAAGYYVARLCGDVPAIPSGTCNVCTTMAVPIPLAANFSYVNNCGTVTFTDISTWLPGYSITSWSWSFPGGSPSSSGSQFPGPVTYSTPGVKTVTLTVSNGTCTSTITLNVNVTTPPSPVFTLPATACVGTSIAMSAGPAFSWAWDFGDAATSALQNTSHAWATPGVYTVKLVVSNASGCKDSSTQTITITSPGGTCPIVPSNPSPICQGDSVVLTAATGASYQWFLNNVFTGVTTQTYSAMVTGSYTVKVTDVFGCVCVSSPVLVVVNPLPPTTISSSATPVICGTGTLTLTAPAGNYTYLWSDNSTTQSIFLVLNTPGTYSYYVIVTDTATGCFDTSATFNVTVYPAPPPPFITASGPTYFCKGDSVTLTSSSPINNLWNTGATTQSITVYASGVYSVTVTSPNGCQSSASITVTVSNDPDFSLYPIGCDDLCDTVKIPGPIGPYIGYYTYQWLYNGSPIPPPNGTNDTLTPVGNGLYQLILTGPGPSFCSDTSNAYSLSLHDCDSVCNSKICGRKWNDKNGNHKFNYGTETGIPNWKICLVRCDEFGRPTKDTIACTLTDSSGYYCFTNLCAGDYCVVEVPKPGWAQTWPINPPFYHVTVGESTVVNGIDFGNKYKCIDIWVTKDTIGIPIDMNIIPAGTPKPVCYPWPIEIRYSPDPLTTPTTIFKGIISENVVPVIGPCPPGTYIIKRDRVANYRPDRIYVNDILWPTMDDSVMIDVTDPEGGLSVLFLHTYEPDTTLRFRTFTAEQLALSDQLKPVKRPKPGKPIPMPNTANVIDEMLRQGGLLIAGMPQQINASGKEKAYLYPKKQGEVFKTFNDKDVVHDGDPRGLALDAKGKLILKRQKSMSAKKHNNVFLANLLALKINILASELGKTPPGFGDLIYVSEVPVFWCNDGDPCTVEKIASVADSLLTNWEGVSYQQYDELNAVIESINEAFAGNLPFAAEDTLSWVTDGKLHLSGAVELSDVPFLIKVSGNAPKAHRDPPMLDRNPDKFELEQNYPNPFNPTTVIRFTLPEEAFVTVKVFNVLGQEVATLMDNVLVDADPQEVVFDAASLSSGIYFYRVTAETPADEDGAKQRFIGTQKMLLMR